MHVLTVDYTLPDAPFLFCKSLRETGFAVLNQHSIPIDLIELSYNKWRDFFATENKNDFSYQKPSQDGYFPFRTEKAKDSDVSDLKEFYHFYPWGKAPTDIKESSLLIYNSLVQLADELLQWIENYLPQHIANNLSMPLKNMIVDSPNTLLRILHYPPLNSQIAHDDAVRAAPHEDINFITLLPAATTPGLEVLSTSGEWHAVSCDPGNIVVNVGDMLQECTSMYYTSTTHRVVNPSKDKNISRFSMPLFLHPCPDVRLSAQYTAKEYLHERLRQIGIY